MRWFAYIMLAIIVGWIAYRGWTLFRRYVLKRSVGRPQPFDCPKCGSKRTDDYSDAESGYCLSCQHVWGVELPVTGDKEG